MMHSEFPRIARGFCVPNNLGHRENSLLVGRQDQSGELGAEPPVESAAAASVRRERNQDWAGPAAARRCQAIDTVVAKSIGNGVIAIAAFAAICSATRRGTVAIRSEPASAAGTAR